MPVGRAVVVAVLGATGRLGRAMARRVAAWRQLQPSLAVRGLARHAPADVTPWNPLVTADRHDVDAVRRLLDGADVVVDLCAFDARDADALLDAWAACARPPRRLIFASALAERSRDQWAVPPPPDAADLVEEDADADAAAGVGGSYGAGKRAARRRFERELTARAVHVITLLLPKIYASDDPAARELRYLADARAHGAALLPGSGEQRPCVVTADDAAEAMWGCALRRLPSVDEGAAGAAWTFQVAPPVQPRLSTLVRALLEEAGLPPVVRAHPDPTWRGPHSGADEIVDGGALRRWLADMGA